MCTVTARGKGEKQKSGQIHSCALLLHFTTSHLPQRTHSLYNSRLPNVGLSPLPALPCHLRGLSSLVIVVVRLGLRFNATVKLFRFFV